MKTSTINPHRGWPHVPGIKHPTPPGMPLHPTNAIRVRLRKGSDMSPTHLFASLLYMFNHGYYQRLACGSCQLCIRVRDVKDVPIEGGRKLKNIAEVKTNVDPNLLRVGDVLLQRVGQRDGCGRPYIVVSIDPLETRGQGFRGGRAAGRTAKDFDRRQLDAGTRVEMEHTTSRKVAQRIAMDHLAEHPDYYIELAKMEAMLRARRLAGNPWIGMDPGTGPSTNPPPSGEDWNYYINFVLYAVVGRTGQADGLMRRHGAGVRRVAATMRELSPRATGTLYRGLLLEPPEAKGGKCKREMKDGEPVRTFESYSETEDVACWFADPNSIISSDVLKRRPGVKGYLAKTKGAGQEERLLWRYDWENVPLPGGRLLPLVAAAAAHPEIDEGQFHWNMKTQAEVVLEPAASRTIKLSPLSGANCPDSDELDATYAYPPFLAQYVRGL